MDFHVHLPYEATVWLATHISHSLLVSKFIFIHQTTQKNLKKKPQWKKIYAGIFLLEEINLEGSIRKIQKQIFSRYLNVHLCFLSIIRVPCSREKCLIFRDSYFKTRNVESGAHYLELDVYICQKLGSLKVWL